jgi:hypothetical protein
LVEVAHTLLRRLHNPHRRECGCDPDCWCRRTKIGRLVKWWFPARYFGIQHKNTALARWKRDNLGRADDSKREQARNGRPARIVGHEPCFQVADVARAVEHYRLLGFSISFHDSSYAFAHRDRLTIHLANSTEPNARQTTLYLHVDDADRLAADWRAAGLEVSGPENTDYGKREGTQRDPDGNLLRFGSPLRRA